MPNRPSVVDICSRLVSFDSSNYGAAGSKGERETADYVMDLLRGAGYGPTLLESAPSRANVLLRVPGTDPGLPGLLVHGHLDVVPAEPEQWSVDPFGGLVRDGYVPAVLPFVGLWWLSRRAGPTRDPRSGSRDG